jgi:hypothetical protein
MLTTSFDFVRAIQASHPVRRLDFADGLNKCSVMNKPAWFRFTCLALLGFSLMAASSQIVSRPTPPSSTFLRSRESAVRLANQRYRDAESAVVKAKTDSARKSAERSMDSASSSLKTAEADLDRAQQDYDRKMDRYNRDLESYQKYLESKKK